MPAHTLQRWRQLFPAAATAQRLVPHLNERPNHGSQRLLARETKRRHSNGDCELKVVAGGRECLGDSLRNRRQGAGWMLAAAIIGGNAASRYYSIASLTYE